MRLRATQKIAIGFVVLTAAVVFGYKFVTDRMVLTQEFPNLAPGKATLIGIDPGAGFRIVVANRIAGLVQGEGSEYGQEGGDESGETVEQAKRKQLSTRDLIAILQGDEKPLGRFVMFLNDIRRNDRDWPTVQVYWTAEELRKALDGDRALRAKLERDLNVGLDGTPLREIRLSSIENGIVVRLPVKVRVRVADQERVLTGIVEQPYRPRFCVQLTDRLYKDKFDVTQAAIQGTYLQLLRELEQGAGQREDVAKSIERMIDPKRLEQMAEAPSKVLSSVEVVVNDSLMESASYSKFVAGNGKELFTISIRLNDEGRRRLWKYSKLHLGTQLLFVVNGTAIAAPVIRQEIPGSEVTISNLTDEELVQEAVDTINKGKGR